MQHPYAVTFDYANSPLLVLYCSVRTLNTYLIRFHLKYRLRISSKLRRNCLTVTLKWTDYCEYELVHPF